MAALGFPIMFDAAIWVPLPEGLQVTASNLLGRLAQ